MENAVLISINPKWCELIASGKKTIEIRKTRPKLETPFKCYIYCTKDEPLYHSGEKFFVNGWDDFGNGKVIGEFVCDSIENFKEFEYEMDVLYRHIKLNACMEYDKIVGYLGSEKRGYGWHIFDLVIYDEPKEIWEFRKPCNKDYDCFLCNKSGYAPDMHIACFNTLTRPPQSWCYVEEVA